MINQTQLIQEEEYSFPYHYIPEYKNFTQSHNWTWGINYIAAIELILNKVKEVQVDSIIDIGCGDGRLTREIFKNINDNVIGIDYSSKAINIAKSLNPNIDFINKDISKDSLNNKYDLAVMIEVFEHIPIDQCENFIKGISNIINPNGALLLTVPHKNKPLQDKHFQHFDSDLINNYFEKYFEIEELIFFDKKTKLTKVLKIVLSNKLYILNNQKLKNIIYKTFKNHCFETSEDRCLRLFAKLKRKND